MHGGALCCSRACPSPSPSPSPSSLCPKSETALPSSRYSYFRRLGYALASAGQMAELCAYPLVRMPGLLLAWKELTPESVGPLPRLPAALVLNLASDARQLVKGRWLLGTDLYCCTATCCWAAGQRTRDGGQLRLLWRWSCGGDIYRGAGGVGSGARRELRRRPPRPARTADGLAEGVMRPVVGVAAAAAAAGADGPMEVDGAAVAGGGGAAQGELPVPPPITLQAAAAAPGVDVEMKGDVEMKEEEEGDAGAAAGEKRAAEAEAAGEEAKRAKEEEGA